MQDLYENVMGGDFHGFVQTVVFDVVAILGANIIMDRLIQHRNALTRDLNRFLHNNQLQE